MIDTQTFLTGAITKNSNYLPNAPTASKLETRFFHNDLIFLAGFREKNRQNFKLSYYL